MALNNNKKKDLIPGSEKKCLFQSHNELLNLYVDYQYGAFSTVWLITFRSLLAAAREPSNGDKCYLVSACDPWILRGVRQCWTLWLAECRVTISQPRITT